MAKTRNPDIGNKHALLAPFPRLPCELCALNIIGILHFRSSNFWPSIVHAYFLTVGTQIRYVVVHMESNLLLTNSNCSRLAMLRRLLYSAGCYASKGFDPVFAWASLRTSVLFPCPRANTQFAPHQRRFVSPTKKLCLELSHTHAYLELDKSKINVLISFPLFFWDCKSGMLAVVPIPIHIIFSVLSLCTSPTVRTRSPSIYCVRTTATSVSNFHFCFLCGLPDLDRSLPSVFVLSFRFFPLRVIYTC